MISAQNYLDEALASQQKENNVSQGAAKEYSDMCQTAKETMDASCRGKWVQINRDVFVIIQ